MLAGEGAFYSSRMVSERDLVQAAAGLGVAFVDLASLPDDFALAALPPFPIVATGDREHPAARLFDAVIEPPISADAVAANIAANPQAASALVQLLRATECEPIATALERESLTYGQLQVGGEHRAWLAARGEQAVGPGGDVRIIRNNELLQIILNRPGALNAIDAGMRDGLYSGFSVAALDPEVRRVELLSVGPAFSIGGDLAEFGTTRDPAESHRIRSLTLPALPLSRRADIVEVHVQGACIGAGLEIAAFAGRVTASPNAWFQLPELAMGLIPGAGGTVSVPRRIGRQRAALLILSGRRIGARTALDWGLIDVIEDRPPVDPDRLDADLR